MVNVIIKLKNFEFFFELGSFFEVLKGLLLMMWIKKINSGKGCVIFKILFLWLCRLMCLSVFFVKFYKVVILDCVILFGCYYVK